MKPFDLSQIQIDKNSAVPIYLQLQEQLEQLIVNGTWQLNDPLPSETMLARQLQISVMTVRQAMTYLVNKELIYREKGRGTFVMPRLLEHLLHNLESFTENIRDKNLIPSSSILEFEICPARSMVATRLQLEPRTPVLHIKRLRFVGRRPVALHDVYLSYTDFERKELESAGSLYAVLEAHNIQLAEAEEHLEATKADAQLAAWLNVPHGEPLLKVTRLTWDHQHIPIETVVAIYRADLYRYTVRLKR